MVFGNGMDRIACLVWVGLVCLCSGAACTPPAELDANDLGPTMDWKELVDLPGDDLSFDPRFSSQVPSAPHMPLLTPTRLDRLPPAIKADPRLAKLAIAAAMDQPVRYQEGVFGAVGASKVYFNTRDRIAHDARLYWVIVKVLSEKYGCFMRSRTDLGRKSEFACKDGRRIVVWRQAGKDWIGFRARQYDAEGYEIVVRQRKIVRISKHRVI